MSLITQQINAQIGGQITLQFGNYVFDESVNINCTVICEAGVFISVSNGCEIILNNGSSFIGGDSKVNISKNGNGHLFRIKSSNINVKNISINNDIATGGYDFLIDTSVSCEYINITDILTKHSFGFLLDNGANGIIVNLHVSNISARHHRGRGVLLTKAFAFIYFKKVCIDFIGSLSPTLSNIPAFVFVNAEGLEMISCDVLGTATLGNCGSQYGFYFQGCRAITLSKLMADNCGGFGFYFIDSSWINADKLKSSMGGSIAFIIANGVNNMYINQFYVSGRVGVPNDTSAQMFYSEANIANVNFTDGMAENYSGLIFGGYAATNIKWTNLK